MTRRLSYVLVTAFLTTSFLAVSASQAESDSDDYVRLARLSYLVGHVSFQHASDADWSAASINLPLEPGDRIYTGPDGRAEIELDDGSVYRLAENTDIEVLTLDEKRIQLRILIGLSTLNVSSGLDFEINTPAAAFNARRKGVYRFSVAENGDTEAIVRKGELEAASNEFSRTIDSGEMLRVSPGRGSEALLSKYNKRDEWDEWQDRRNVDRNAYKSRQYLPDSVYMGVSELDRYGQWVDVDYYGSAWVPNWVDSYWSPYSLGRWCYRPLSGWTWISYEPWGWLPYHYGRWYRHSHHGWCWLPGPGFSFNFWSPGLVSFYSGPGWVSWCPLGPGDYYGINHYRYNRGIYSYQLSQLRNLHTRRPGDPFNRNVHGAFHTTGIDHFRNGSFQDRDRRTPFPNVDQPWRQGSWAGDRPAVQPTATSYRPAAPDRPAVRPNENASLPAVVRNMPRTLNGDRNRLTAISNPQMRSSGAAPRQGANTGITDDGRRPTQPNIQVVDVPGVGRTIRNTGPVTRPAPADREARTLTDTVVRPQTSPPGARRAYSTVPDAGTRTITDPVTRPQATDRSTQGRSYTWRSERPVQERPRTYSAPVAPAAPVEIRPQNSPVIPRSNSGGGWNNPGAGARAPESRRTTIYSAPRQSSSFMGAGRSGGVRSMPAPSAGRSGGNSGSPAGGRSGGVSNSGRNRQ